MMKAKKIIVMLLFTVMLLSGCANCNSISDDVKTTVNTSDSGEIEDDFNQDFREIDYDFSIYDDGRVFSEEQIAVQMEFEEYLNDIFVDEMKDNPISLRFSIEHPENYGLSDVEIEWGDFNYLDITDSEAELKVIKSKLKSYDYESLTYEQQLIYDIMLEYMENELTAVDCILFSSAFAPISGIQCQIPVIFSEYTFLEKKNIDEYINLLNTSYDYVYQLCQYEKYRMEQGYSLSAYSLDLVIEQCNDFISENPNCLRPVFEDKIKSFDSLTETEIEQYMEAFDQGLSGSLIPAYELIISTLNEIKEQNKSKGGMCNYDGGRSYYEYLVKFNTGSSRDIDEIYQMIQDSMMQCSLEFSQLYMRDTDILDEMYEYENSITEPEDMLQCLITALEEDFPKAVNDNYTINYVPESLESTMTPAYYVIPPIDNINKNNIFINNNEDYADMNLFSTIAHEGFPGHMYQTTYFYSLNPHYLRSLMEFDGYVEGWAEYIEINYSYKYSDMDENIAQAYSINASLSMAVYCATDIGINYYGWNYDDTYEFLSTYMGEDTEIIDEIYYTMIDEPSVYLRYYVGCLEFLSLRDAAQEALGSAFDIREFHRFLLEIGPCQFDIIADRMDGWINRASGYYINAENIE